MPFRPTTALVLLTLLSIISIVHAADSPYVGQESRAIKALSEQEIGDYLAGRGMGTSKVAELNHYPDPKHVLDEATELELSSDQLARIKECFNEMSISATRFGKEIVQQEAALEALYASTNASTVNTSDLIITLAKLKADFRIVHLNAHLRVRKILTPQQIALYDQLRGYDSPHAGTGDEHH